MKMKGKSEVPIRFIQNQAIKNSMKLAKVLQSKLLNVISEGHKIFGDFGQARFANGRQHIKK